MKTIIITSILDAIFHVKDGHKLNTGWFYNLKNESDQEIQQELQNAFTGDSEAIKHIQQSLSQAKQDGRFLAKQSSLRDTTIFLLKLRQSIKI